MKKLLIYLKNYKKETVLAPLFKLLEATFELIVPLVMASIIDKGIGQNDKSHIIYMGLLMVGLGVIGLICSITAQYFSAKAAVGFSTELKSALFKHIQGLSFTEIDKLGTSTLITRLTSDVNQLQNGVNMVLRLFLRSPFIVIGAMIMAFTVDVKAALIFVIIIPLLCIVVFTIMGVTIPMFKKVQTGLDNVLLKTRENLTGARVIRAFGKEDSEIEKYVDSNEFLTSMQKKTAKISGLMNPITYVIVNAGIVGLLYSGAIRVDNGIISQGAVVALVNYMSQILVELIKLANLIILVTKAIASGNRVASIFEHENSHCEVEETIEDSNFEDFKDYSVAFDNVSLKYADGSDEALENINFKVKKGETIGIIGGTGSGKSSLVNMIPRFYDATLGNIYVNGINVKNYKKNELRNKVGIVLQKAVLFKGTIRENILWGKKDATDKEIMEALEVAQATDVVMKKEGKLDEMIAQGGKNLSGGQKQRLTIARAIIRNPEILILDDSASALDFATDAALRKAIRNLDYKPTVFIVSQRAASIMYADQIIVLDDGLVVGIGKHESLLENCNVYREIYESQFKVKEA
jgi:ATP-binding cassette, subfamily B, multidrug efflux pump